MDPGIFSLDLIYYYSNWPKDFQPNFRSIVETMDAIRLVEHVANLPCLGVFDYGLTAASSSTGIKHVSIYALQFCITRQGP